MCGITGLHLRNPALEPQLGELLSAMMCQMSERGPDSAGVGIYGDPRYTPPGHSAVGVIHQTDDPDGLASTVSVLIGSNTSIVRCAETTILHAAISPETLLAAVRTALPDVVVTSWGENLAVIKGIGLPVDIAEAIDLTSATGYQAVAHTRMATESAVTTSGSHPFSVGSDQCLVHNGSFSNHATIRRQLKADGVVFDSENDTEVGARFVAAQLAGGADLEKALRMLTETFDGFYTLLVTTADSFAVVRDPIACKPAVIAETEDWVAMASEYRALAGLPGIEGARITEPEPERIYLWQR